MNLSKLSTELSERGAWWQVGGFAITAFPTLAILVEFAGSEARAYRYLQTAAKDLEWAFIILLIALFEGARKMFEKASEIRAAQREKIREKGRQEGRREGQQELNSRMQEAYERFGVEQNGVMLLPRTPEVEKFLSGESDDRS